MKGYLLRGMVVHSLCCGVGMVTVEMLAAPGDRCLSCGPPGAPASNSDPVEFSRADAAGKPSRRDSTTRQRTSAVVSTRCVYSAGEPIPRVF